MISLEISELTGKKHFHVMEAIRRMEPAWERIAESKFRLGTYKYANEQLRPCYLLTKTECLYIATKFNDEARAKLVLRWEELEIAELTGKQHKNLMQAIRNMDPAWEKVHGLKFQLMFREVRIGNGAVRRHWGTASLSMQSRCMSMRTTKPLP